MTEEHLSLSIMFIKDGHMLGYKFQFKGKEYGDFVNCPASERTIHAIMPSLLLKASKNLEEIIKNPDV